MKKKLKIRADADPKELDKYLMKLDIMEDNDKIFKHDVYCCVNEEYANTYDNKTYRFEVEFYINEKREITYCVYPECRNEEFILEKVYDLIKAGLLIKEED